MSEIRSKTLSVTLAASYPIVAVDRILRNSFAAKRLLVYCNSQHSEENFLFWTDHRDWRALQETDTRNKQGDNIFHKFLRVGAELEICMNSQTCKAVRSAFTEGRMFAAFELAEKDAFNTLKNDVFPRFVKTPIYSRLIEELLLILFSTSESVQSILSGEKQLSKDQSIHYQEMVPSLEHVMSNPLGVEMFRKFLYKSGHGRVDVLALYFAVDDLLESRFCTSDAEWKEKSLLLFRDLVDVKDRHGNKNHKDHSESSASAAASAVDAADRGTLSQSIKDVLQESLSLPAPSRSCWNDAKEYLWKSLSVYYVDFLESDSYRNGLDDYRILCKAEEDKRTKEMRRHSISQASRSVSASSVPLPSAQSPSVKPVAEEDTSISVSVAGAGSSFHKMPFEDVVADQEVLQLFTQFCQKEYSEENILFWRAVQEFRFTHAQSANMSDEIVEIYSRFIKPGTQMEVPIDSSTKKDVKKKVDSQQFEITIFDEAQRLVFEFMRGDSYIRFLQSDMYKALMLKREAAAAQRTGSCFGLCFGSRSTTTSGHNRRKTAM